MLGWVSSPYPPYDPYGRPQQPYGPPPGYPGYPPPQGRFVPLPGPIAGLDARFVQHLIDLVVMLGPYLVLVAVSTAVIVVGAAQEIGGLIAVGSILYVLGSLGVIGLQVYLQIFDAYKHGGQTYGMRRRGLRVVKMDGSPLTQGDLALRWLLLWAIDSGLVGLICIAATQNKQRLGDMAAKTLVVHTGP
jgi:uncharacterized RDD family membrane protein YckC